MNINTDNVAELESHTSLTRNGSSFVVNLFQKKTPTGTKVGGATRLNSYRTIEDVKICGTGDQPDAPKQTNKIVKQ